MRILFSFFLLAFLFSTREGASGSADTTRTIIGTVTDLLDKKPLPGVQVTLKNNRIQAVTDTAGRYVLRNVPNDAQMLTFSFIGYNSITIRIKKGQLVADVQLSPNIQGTMLSEVVVVGYSTAQKKELTGAVSSFVPALPMHSQSRFNTEDYSAINENRFHDARQQPVTTFSADVDRASYSNVRRFINAGNLPPKDAVRIEEMINYFEYDYAQPTGKDPIAVHTELSESPWNKGLQLLRVGLQARTISAEKLPAANLVFLIDVSGSMQTENKLPLVQSALNLLVDQLRPQDRVALVVYAGAAGLVLPSTPGSERQRIKEAINGLQAGGSTAGGAGIQLAYQTALQSFQKEGNNRVILATDGDFNVGESGDAALQRLIEEKRKTGIYLSVLGFGMGNYKDNKLETLADKGNGNYAYIDNWQEAHKIFVKEFGGTLFTVAKDVKLQLEFNPAHVKAYRLIGYENRMLRNEDFKDDQKDAGEMGSGHTVTALYEIIPAGVESTYFAQSDSLKYQKKAMIMAHPNELLTLKIRYKHPNEDKSHLLEHPVSHRPQPWLQTSDDFRFAAAVAGFGLLLRESEYKGEANFDQIASLAQKALGADTEGYRSELIRLMKAAKALNSNEVSKK